MANKKKEENIKEMINEAIDVDIKEEKKEEKEENNKKGKIKYLKNKIVVKVIHGAGICNFYTKNGSPISSEELVDKALIIDEDIYNNSKNFDFKKRSMIVATNLYED